MHAFLEYTKYNTPANSKIHHGETSNSKLCTLNYVTKQDMNVSLSIKWTDSVTNIVMYSNYFYLSMEPLYPPGLDENRAVDDLYPASWICSEITLLHWKKICNVQ